MNVAIITPCLSEGGAEKIAGLLSKRLEKNENIFIFIFHPNIITYEYAGKLVDTGFDEINAIFSNYGKIVYFFSTPLKYLLFINNLKKLKKENKIECSISFLERPNILNILSKTNSFEKILVSVRSVRSERKDSRYEYLENFFVKTIYSKADKIITISEGVKQDLIDKFHLQSSRIKSIYNFFDLEKIKELSLCKIPDNWANLFSKNKIIITVGRLHPVKNHKLLISSFSIIASKFPSYKLVIIGDGILKHELEQYTQSLKLDNKVYFVPFTANPFSFMKNSNFFVLTSNSEGYGNVLLEAMACNLPIVSIDCPVGPREIIADENYYNRKLSETTVFERGILVPKTNDENKNSKNLADALILLISNKKLQDSIKRNCSIYLNNFDVSKLTQQWLEEIYS